MTRSTRSSMQRVSYFRVLSDQSGRILPHPKRCLNNSNTSARSPFWLIEKLGRISHPNLCRALLLKDTQKHPSPSAYPVRYAPTSTLPPRKRPRRVMSAVNYPNVAIISPCVLRQGSVVTGSVNQPRTSHGITLPSTSCPCTTRARASPLSAGTGLRVLTRQGISLSWSPLFPEELDYIFPDLDSCLPPLTGSSRSLQASSALHGPSTLAPS